MSSHKTFPSAPKTLSTLVLGASLNPARASFEAVSRLARAGHPTVAVGRKSGSIAGIAIETDPATIHIPQLDTLTLYLNPYNQIAYYQWILDLKPRRVIFNPGTENPVLEQKLREADIEAVRACTLVMLGTGQYAS